MTDKSKKVVRDIQRRTGWKYTFCLFLVQQLGYEAVSQAVDDNEGTMEALGDTLHARAKAAERGSP